MKIIPVILAGGLGSRLWPLSKEEYPKQYLTLVGDNSMLQETILRLNGLDNLAEPIIVCNEEHRFIVAEQCMQIGVKNHTTILEPIGRNTAPAITVAALQSLKKMNNSILLVLPADHIIQDIEEFHNAVKIGFKEAQGGMLVTFGAVPTDANTGYGYIKSSGCGVNEVHKVEKFVEKPNLKTAQSYFEQGGYLWNSGMFMFQANVLINELTLYSHNIVEAAIGAVNNAVKDLDFIRLDKQKFESSPANSIDYALMEKSDNVVVVPFDAKWNDIGSWSALYDIGIKDKSGNVIKGDVVCMDSTNNYIDSKNKLVVTIGVDNLIVVDTADVVLISRKDKVQKIKSVISNIQSNNIGKYHDNRKVHRPWGWYDVLDFGSFYKVKRIYVKPNSRLSLQMHYKRVEYWVVVEGEATVINNGETFTLTKGESTYIPIESVHSLCNNTNNLLEIIEVQSGSYLEEDDIVRFEDIYNRETIKGKNA